MARIAIPFRDFRKNQPKTPRKTMLTDAPRSWIGGTKRGPRMNGSSLIGSTSGFVSAPHMRGPTPRRMAARPIVAMTTAMIARPMRRRSITRSRPKPNATMAASPRGTAAMVAFGFGLERVMLRRLIGRPIIAVVMATIGLAAILRGVGPLTWGAETKPLALPISDEPFIVGPLFIPPIQLLGASVSLVLLGVFGWFFLKSRKGIAMRAIADSQQVAMAM